MLCSVWIYSDIFIVWKITSHQSEIHILFTLYISGLYFTLLCSNKMEINQNIIRSRQSLFPDTGTAAITLYVVMLIHQLIP